jgi:hypothetical protein
MKRGTMFDRPQAIGSLFWLGLSVILCSGSGAIAQNAAGRPDAAWRQDAAWHIGKSSGEVWLTGAGVQQASLTADTILKPGDTIRTGASGQVLLVRGEESILISPNSVIGIPAEPKDGLSTIIQQAGSILLELEKRTVRHFEVLTPYFTAGGVKGAQFWVSVNNSDGNVDVLRGQVEVADFKTGRHALVLPGQAAKVSARGPGGLFLNGPGALSQILKGQPRASLVKLVPVPKEGLAAPGDLPKGQQIRVVSAIGALDPLRASSAVAGLPPNPSGTLDPAKKGDGSPASAALVPVSNDGISDRPQVDMGSALSRAAALHAAGEANASKNNGWSSDILRWSDGGSNQTARRTNRNAEMAFDLATSLAVGAGVAVVVAISRRRRRAPTVTISR